ncbi:MAG: hypothetical protein E7623_04470 [Ruminococcaceae bacterium]|nr:hypothetical protein [Oscillospiraceae bacterium]
MRPKILALGEIIWDVYENGSFIGGAPLNFTAHCVRCGMEGYIFSAVGKDSYGDRAIEIIKDMGVGSDYIKITEKSTGQCTVTLDEKGKPDFYVHSDTAYDNIPLSEGDISAINESGYDALYFGTLIQRSPVSRATVRRICKEGHFGEIVCDINLRKNCYDADSAAFCLENATLLKISEDEEPTLREMGLYSSYSDSYEDICRSVCEKYTQVKYLILTLGAKGSFIYSAKDKKSFIQPSRDVKVVSTVGAGDSYLAAWISSYLSGESIERASQIATDISEFVVTKEGAIPDYRLLEGKIYE